MNDEFNNDSGILFRDESYLIQGAIFEVYKELGAGFLESVYQECLEKELELRKIPFQSQKEIRVIYKNQQLKSCFKADIICYESIVIELKACRALEPIHRAQILNYLKATNLSLGLLVNFNAHPKVTVERFIL